MRYFFYSVILLFACSSLEAFAQQSELTVQKIMQEPKDWIGASPGVPFWGEDGETVYFFWNPKGEYPSDSLFKITKGNLDPTQVSPEERLNLPPRFTGWQHGSHTYTADFSTKVFAREGDLFLYEVQKNILRRLTRTRDVENNPRFTPGGEAIVFRKGSNLFKWNLKTGELGELTDIRTGKEPGDPKVSSDDAFLLDQQMELFDYIREEAEEKELDENAEEQVKNLKGTPSAFFLADRRVQNVQIDPNERFVTLLLNAAGGGRERTEVQDYVTESGYAEILNARPKVGQSATGQQFYIQDLARDTTYQVDLDKLPGAYEVPAYKRDETGAADSSKANRHLFVTSIEWSGDGSYCMVDVRASDNKSRWLALLDPESGELSEINKQQDDAWIAGPGIGWSRRGGRTSGWMPDNLHYFFQSEETGFSHLYVVNASTGEKRALTEGDFEVFAPELSQDGKTWHFSSSEVSPFVRHFYSMPAWGGERTALTTKEGNNRVALSPDEKSMAIHYSYSNKPPELYFVSSEGDEHQITHSTHEEWESYAWRDPEIVHIDASDEVKVPARIYVPEEPNGAAVLFVHGAGYLQNVHKWWSGYYREYMFHNLLADLGYVVLDVDYRASAGYGRDWRTAIYRHMGGRDLQDYVDASRYVNEKHDIDPERVFIYGGSYGGFITLMALFTEPEHFGGGAALRAVTDWAHYNHPYTSNILNTPAEDSLAYRQSSPIYFAEGLEDPLLIAHGMVDTNVQFQDVVRLAQRLIELGKEDWEMAVYPVEGHGFTEPSSWTDEYRRILELIKKTVGPDRDTTMNLGEE